MGGKGKIFKTAGGNRQTALKEKRKGGDGRSRMAARTSVKMVKV